MFLDSGRKPEYLQRTHTEENKQTAQRWWIQTLDLLTVRQKYKSCTTTLPELQLTIT